MQFHRKVTSVMSLFIGIFFILLCFNFSAVGQGKIETGNLFVTNYNRSFLNTYVQIWYIVQDSEGIFYYGNNVKGFQTFDGQKVRPVLDEKGGPAEGFGHRR